MKRVSSSSDQLSTKRVRKAAGGSSVPSLDQVRDLFSLVSLCVSSLRKVVFLPWSGPPLSGALRPNSALQEGRWSAALRGVHSRAFQAVRFRLKTSE